MKGVDRLRRDHTILRAKLDVVEATVNMSPETWYVLREVCLTLSRQLRDHIKREEALVVACRTMMNPKVLAEIVVEHREEPLHLRAINRLFVSERGQPFSQIKPALLSVVDGLRRHMAEEEAELFPVLERVLADREAEEPSASRAAPLRERLFDEATTVNRAVQACPETRPVFEQLLISIPAEGCSCLDEVAWRHGMDCRELLERLEAAVGSCACGSRHHAHEADPERTASSRIAGVTR